MIRITKKEAKAPRRYAVTTVAFALGVTEGAVRGCFRVDDMSLKDGLTLDQVEVVINRKTRGSGVCWKRVEELRDDLRCIGYEIDDVPYEEEEELPL
jgi:hypothetical protein